MALPRVLKNFNLSQDGESWLGKVATVTLPKLSRKTEDLINGGMAGPVEIDLGQEKIEIAFSANELLRGPMRAYAATTVDAVGLRWSGAYQSDDTGLYDAVEVVARGRYKEIDPGDSKAQTLTEVKYTMPCAYYKLTVNGSIEIEYDALANILIVDGIDVLAAQRAALGQW
jgi:P2 family phage contractile tail tube protein